QSRAGLVRHIISCGTLPTYTTVSRAYAIAPKPRNVSQPREGRYSALQRNSVFFQSAPGVFVFFIRRMHLGGNMRNRYRRVLLGLTVLLSTVAGIGGRALAVTITEFPTPHSQ